MLVQLKTIHNYYQGMGGVDTLDEFAQTYPSLGPNKNNWRSLFLDLLDMDGVNSFIFQQVCRE